MLNKELLVNIASNPELLAVVKETVLEHFAEQPFAEGASDELLGQITRARMAGIKRVGDAFREIESYRKTPEIEPKDNPVY